MSDFLSSWVLFARPYGLTLQAAAVLGAMGVVTAARRQVFMAAAVAQAGVFGYALFTALAGGVISAAAADMGGGIVRDAVVIGAALAAAAITMLGGAGQAQGGRLGGDELTALVFIAAGAGAILLLASSPVGMEQFRRLQASSVIGATPRDVAGFAAMLVIGGACLTRWMRPLVLLLADPGMAAAVGLRVTYWHVALTLAVGLSVGLAVASTGMLFAFGVLALPVMIGKQFCGEVRALFIASPLIAIGGALAGLYLAYTLDLPPGQVTVGLLCLILTIALLARKAWEYAAY